MQIIVDECLQFTFDIDSLTITVTGSLTLKSKKINYDNDYVTIKRFNGKYDSIEECKMYGLREIVYCAQQKTENIYR